jgi:hypothetical protein
VGVAIAMMFGGAADGRAAAPGAGSAGTGVDRRPLDGAWSFRPSRDH